MSSVVVKIVDGFQRCARSLIQARDDLQLVLGLPNQPLGL